MAVLFQTEDIFPQTSAFSELHHQLWGTFVHFVFRFHTLSCYFISLLCFGGILAQLPEFSSMITFPVLWKYPFLTQIQKLTQILLILAV